MKAEKLKRELAKLYKKKENQAQKGIRLANKYGRDSNHCKKVEDKLAELDNKITKKEKQLQKMFFV